jgi:hypothetical protein
MKRSVFRALLAASLLGPLVGSAEQSQPQQPQQKQPPKKTEDDSKPKRERKVPDLSGFDLLEPDKTRDKPMVVGATRGAPRPVTLAPRLGKAYGLNPTFEWSYEGKVQEFVFVLRDDAQEEVFRAEVTGTRYKYPDNAPPLRPERTYFWTVETVSAILASRSAPCGVLVVSPNQREEIERSLAQISAHDAYMAALSRARLFTEHRLWYDAVAAYTDLVARYPDRAELYRERGTIYAQLDATQVLADADFARTDELQGILKGPE